ncbi:unnamed protein product, partial [Rotaria sp. Silwood1]
VLHVDGVADGVCGDELKRDSLEWPGDKIFFKV